MIAERLMQARKAAGLSVQALSAKAGDVVTPQAISKYEKGKCKPTSATLLALAKALDVRTEHFFRPMAVDLGPIHFRKHSRVPAKTLDLIEGRTRDFMERYLTLEEVFPPGRFPLFRNPLQSAIISATENVEVLAETLRQSWRIGLDPIPNMTELLEGQGIKVILISGKKGFGGLSATAQGNRPIIVVGKEWPGERQRMTLAQELGHVILPEAGTVRGQKELAKRFAGALLVPAETARGELGQRRRTLDWGELFTLKRRFGLSVRAWLVRAKDLEIIDDNRYGSLLKDYNRRGWRAGEPCPLPEEEPTRFRRLLYQGLAEGFLAKTKAAELDGRPLREFLMVMDKEGATLAGHSRRR